MYFPYLRGKQYELLALKDFSQISPNNAKIIPVIEPVKSQVNGLNSALEVLRDNAMRFAVILNPKDGDFKKDRDNDIFPKLPILERDRTSWIPAYFYKGRVDKLVSHAEKNQLDNIMVVFPDGVNAHDEGVIELVANKKVRYVMVANSSIVAFTKLKSMGKEVILLDDHFELQTKNADYALAPDEFFSDDFVSYKENGFFGFSDYTALPKVFSEGGSLPYAIAIHLTYQKSPEEIFVHHFVSDNNVDQSNIRGKFHEAAVKIGPFYKEGGYQETSAVIELIDKSSDVAGYPGLGYIKKLSIENHLELIDRLITE